MECCVDADFGNDCITTSIGPCIVIDNDGGVYDQDAAKVIVKKTDYETDEERNALIEAWMEKSGYFPSVVRCDYYGNPLGYVSTKEKES